MLPPGAWPLDFGWDERKSGGGMLTMPLWSLRGARETGVQPSCRVQGKSGLPRAAAVEAGEDRDVCRPRWMKRVSGCGGVLKGAARCDL